MYLYGDIHAEFYGRLMLQAKIVKASLSLKYLRFLMDVRSLERISLEQGRYMAAKFTALHANQDNQFTVMHEGDAVTYPTILRALRHIAGANNKRLATSLCPKCCAFYHKASKAFTGVMENTSQAIVVLHPILNNLPDSLRVLCVDRERQRYKQIERCINLLNSAHCLFCAGLDCSIVQAGIRKEMGLTSLRDLGISFGKCLTEASLSPKQLDVLYPLAPMQDMPLYEVVQFLHSKVRVLREEYCRAGKHISQKVNASDEQEEAVIGATILLNTISSALKSSAPTYSTSLEECAFKEISYRANTKEQNTFVLIAGGGHTERLEDMLRKRGFQVLYKSASQLNPEDDQTEEEFLALFKRVAKSALKQEDFDILDPAVLKQKAPRPAPRGVWNRLRARL